MPIKIPDQKETHTYRRIPFGFSQKLSESELFINLPDNFSPLERIVLQSTGNLQRILSSYFNAPSRVEILKNAPISTKSIHEENTTHLAIEYSDDIHLSASDDHPMFERKIRVFLGDLMAYEADSVVTVQNHQVLNLLSTHHFGLGQLFSRLRVTPQFSLIAVGRHSTAPGSSFWRDYTLTVPGAIDCTIRETFIEGLFEPCAENTKKDGVIWYTK